MENNNYPNDYKMREYYSNVGGDDSDTFHIFFTRKIEESFNKFDIKFSDTFTGYISRNIDIDELVSFLKSIGEVYGFRDTSCYIVIDNEGKNIARIYIHFEESGIPWYKATLHSTSIEDLENVKSKFRKEIEESNGLDIAVINMLFKKADGRIVDYTKRELIDDETHQEAYPFVNKGDIDNYINNYLISNESVLVLIGPPGTGKTRLIRHILRKSIYNSEGTNKVKAKLNPEKRIYTYYTNSESVLNSDEIFMKMLSNDICFLVLEDIDFHLRDRGEDNPLMYKLLSVTDGLIKGGQNKIIISTNVDNERDIDQALTRVGRCFDIARFRNLNSEEANTMLQKLSGDSSVSMPEEKDYSLSEVYRYFNKGSLNSQPENSTLTRGKKPGFR